MKIRCLYFAGAVLLVAAAPGAAQITLDFDNDVTIFQNTFVVGHLGFDFTGSFGTNSWVHATDFAGFNPVSAPFLVWSNGGHQLEFSRVTSFNFFSAWMGADFGTGCAVPPVDQTVRGFRTGVEVFTQVVTIACGPPLAQFAFNFTNVDRVVFAGGGLNPGGTIALVLDDLMVGDVSVPEPATFFLLFAGLLGLVVEARRRRYVYSSET